MHNGIEAHFSVDSAMELVDYRELLRDLASDEELESKVGAGHFHISNVQKFIKDAMEQCATFAAVKPDLAYYFCYKALNVAKRWWLYTKDAANNCPEDVKEHARTLLSPVVKCVGTLEKESLPPLLEKLMARVRVQQPERDRLRRLQMENVEDDAAKIGDRSAQEVEAALLSGPDPASAAAAAAASSMYDQYGGVTILADGSSSDAAEQQPSQHPLLADEERRLQLLRDEQQKLAELRSGLTLQNFLPATTGGSGSAPPPPPPPPQIPPPPPPSLDFSSSAAGGNQLGVYGDIIDGFKVPVFTTATTVAAVTEGARGLYPPLPSSEVQPSSAAPPPSIQDLRRGFLDSINVPRGPTSATTISPASTITPSTVSPSRDEGARPSMFEIAAAGTLATATGTGGFVPVSTVSVAPPTAATTAALERAKQFLNSNPSPHQLPPVPQHQQPAARLPPPPSVIVAAPNQIPAASPSSIPRPLSVPVAQPISRPPPQQQQRQLILPPPRMFQNGRNALWRYPSPPSSVAAHPRRGLTNLGNSCYQNSVMQCLCVTPLRALLNSSESFDNVRLACALKYVFKSLRPPRPTTVPFGPSAVKQAVALTRPQFGTTQQQDASEFFVEVLDILCTETSNKTPSATSDIDTKRLPDVRIAKEFYDRFRCHNNSRIGELFSFQLRQQNMCERCHEAARNFDVNLSLDLPIPLGAPTGAVATLQDCLSLFIKPERTLENSRDAFFKCDTCRKTVGSTHQTTLYSLPKILVITLKRFKQSMSGNFSDKVNVPVVYPLEFDMAPFMLPESRAALLAQNSPSGGGGGGGQVSTRFRLVGHVSHQGNMHGGHYTATTWDAGDNNWNFASDERVNPCGGAQADFSFAYMLFYVRQDA